MIPNYNFMQIKLITLSTLCLLFSVALQAQEFRFKEGQKIKSNSSDAVFLVIDQQVRELDTSILFSGLFNDYRNSKILSDSLFKTIRLGNKINEAYLIRSYSDAVYLYIDATKRHIDSPLVMEAFGFNWNFVKRMAPNEINEIPTGNKITLEGTPTEPLPCGVRDDD